ncbi:hypothetical protein T07_10734 [Trichinella nelsoni]|uniref:Uncharacterized protein n=1 Tax=Trichinella nelsoni TaxID=6336 RepID=A0A0V0SJW9_9BILA|nr:hypothetical protein T07_10734 [Trichinella nelsoni]
MTIEKRRKRINDDDDDDDVSAQSKINTLATGCKPPAGNWDAKPVRKPDHRPVGGASWTQSPFPEVHYW